MAGTAVGQPNKTTQKSNTYPVAEFFTSIQGEATWAGTRMFFCRLAGCNVGKPYPKSAYLDKSSPAYTLPIYMEQCESILGQKFSCDTNFQSKTKLSPSDIVNLCPNEVEHVCLTGGEPLMHDLSPLIVHLFQKKKMIHIETSGTKNLSALPIHRREEIWITCSPKKGALPEVIKRADELKLLVDEHFDPSKLPEEILNHSCVWLQPIGEEHCTIPKNLELCLQWQVKFPNWRLSLQLHKVVGQFLNRIIR